MAICGGMKDKKSTVPVKANTVIKTIAVKVEATDDIIVLSLIA